MTHHHNSNKDFKVTDDELLQSFLYNKIHNKPLPDYMTILEYDLFGTVKNPCEIWEEFAAFHSYSGKDLYFFSTLKKKSATSTRMDRTIGTGSWEGENSGKSVFAKNTNQLLGIKKRYRFEKSKMDSDGGWILHEYILDQSLISNPSASNYVLCRFRKNLKLDTQNTGTRINQQSNSNKNSRTKNVGQNKQRKTVVTPCAATTTTITGISR
ncbi:unnamed protein product [Trifolium pratense]|uniref:Uncharacterized protein n=1 Tax=Trifolium pratense TaxID=57577 RepID=A0ACB0MAP1_TRIPR|nr:unnamed protein product [Trifolium pratense]